MSRKLLALLTALVLGLTLTTYVYYRRTLAAVPLDAYALVPDDAVLLLSTHDHPALVRHLQEIQVWDNLTAVGYFQQAAGHLALADSLAGSSARQSGLLRLLGRKLVLTSLHITGPEKYDLLFQVPLTTVREYRQVRGLLSALGRDRRYRLATRDVDGHELSLLTEVSSAASLTVVNYRNRLLLSSSPALVEAALRRAGRTGSGAAPTVAADFQELDLLRGRGVDGTLLVNYRRLPALLDVLFRPGRPAAPDYLSTLARNGLLQVRLAGNRVVAQGFSNPETATDALHPRLLGLPAGSLTPLADLMSQRTALLLYLAAPTARPRPAGVLLAPAAGRAAATGALPALPPGISPGTSPGTSPDPALSAAHRAALDSLRATLGAEVAVAYLASPAPGRPAAQVAFVRCPDPVRTARWLGRERRAAGLSPAFSKVGPYALYAAGFGAEEVLGRLAARGQPATGEFAEFELDSRAAVLVGGYLVLGEAPALQAYLTDVVAQKVWTRSAGQMAFLSELLPRARLSVVIDTRQAWNALLGALREDRRAGLLRHETLFKKLPQMAWQLAPADDEAAPGAQYYTQLLLRHPQQSPVATVANAATASPGLVFKRALRGAPLPLPLAGGAPRPAVLLTDSAGVAHFISPDDVVLWSDTLGAAPVGLPQLVNLRAGGPPHLLLATAGRLHLLGAADGREAPHFPFNLPDSLRATAVVAASVGQAASGTAPRLLVVAGPRTLLLVDADGRQFPGWQPKRLDAPLAGAPLLLSIGGRDVVLALLQNGYVYAFDQQGNPWPGFPLSVGARLAGGAWVQPGATLSRSRVAVVNQHGELVRFTLGGEVLSRRRIATWSRTARFRLVPSQPVGPNGVSPAAVVVREDGGQLAVFRPDGGPAVLTQGFLTSDEKPVQFFDFGRGRQVLALTEPGPGQVFLYDGRGQRLSLDALPSTGSGVGLSAPAAPGGRYQLVRAVGKELRRAEL